MEGAGRAVSTGGGGQCGVCADAAGMETRKSKYLLREVDFLDDMALGSHITYAFMAVIILVAAIWAGVSFHIDTRHIILIVIDLAGFLVPLGWLVCLGLHIKNELFSQPSSY